jgi:hypothetical protein
VCSSDTHVAYSKSRIGILTAQALSHARAY